MNDVGDQLIFDSISEPMKQGLNLNPKKRNNVSENASIFKNQLNFNLVCRLKN